MNIIQTENPLETKVILDDNDRKILRLKVVNDELDWILIEIVEHVKKNNFDAIKKCSEEYKNTTAFNNVVKKLVLEYENDLKHTHYGDCIRFACTCTKCKAEDYLDICTIPDLDSYSGYIIDKCFRELKTIDKVISYLQNSKVEGDKKAHQWLINYKLKL